MTINTYTLGPGTLTFGSAPLAAGAQVRSCRVQASENVTETPAIPVLSGETIAASSAQTYSYVITGKFLQDLSSLTALVGWSWTNKGTPQAFTFTPKTGTRTVTGTVIPIPLDIGGDVNNPGEGDPPDADFTWRIVGTPVLT